MNIVNIILNLQTKTFHFGTWKRNCEHKSIPTFLSLVMIPKLFAECIRTQYTNTLHLLETNLLTQIIQTIITLQCLLLRTHQTRGKLVQCLLLKFHLKARG
ncbi:hypothetical protein Leryth_019313 [Lithospermum erythrorhizon]|nr:hypothetical protein Leryth_019313 [Lithospermum erythrorhizon]